MNSWILIGGDVLFLVLMMQGRIAQNKAIAAGKAQAEHVNLMLSALLDNSNAHSNLVTRAISELPKRRSKKASKEQI